jgi:superfamily II DNA/RNA helicase
LSSALAGVDQPATSFVDLGLPDRLIEVLSRRGIKRPLPIQAAAIADVLGGVDVAGKAPTGSGKTLAFALPIAATLTRAAPRRPHGLVLAPTRELASQIASEMSPLLAVRSLRAYPFYGGVGFGGQRSALRRGVDVAVACPGRLEDLMSSGDVELSDVDVVVVDEADRLADMGFLPAVCRILDATSSGRQTLLFSATLDGDVDVLVRRYQHNPVRHEVSTQEEVSRASHQFRAVASADRAALCAELVNAPGPSVVFVRTKHGADRVARRLRDAGAAAAAIHGDRSQAQRERTLADFRAGKVQVLVATDVAARGIHVDQVARVIHYDLPADLKDYVHRSGRTARAGAEGIVIALVTPEKRALADSLQRGLRGTIETVGAVSSSDASAWARPQNSAPQSPARGARRRAHGRSRASAARRRDEGRQFTGRTRAPVSQAAGNGRRRKARR